MWTGVLSRRGCIKQPCLARTRHLNPQGHQNLIAHFSSKSTLAEADDVFFRRDASLNTREHAISDIRSEMIARPPTACVDNRNNEQSVLLSNTLQDFLPQSYADALVKKRVANTDMPPGYQLVYFPFYGPLSHLMDDGTDPAHWPGPPYNRRMWAGGFMHFFRPIPFYSENRQCVETIPDVEVKGKEGEEKVFVVLKRSVLETDPAPLMVEGRRLVFMRDHSQARELPVPRLVKPPSSAHYSHTLTPTAGLLFRFSALSYNAHRIHLDKEYCQKVEGHRNLLVHGPLTLILMLEMLSGHIAESPEEILRIEYRNLAPLYAEEPMTVCGKQRALGEYEVWIEGKEGGLAVKGFVRTQRTR